MWKGKKGIINFVKFELMDNPQEKTKLYVGNTSAFLKHLTPKSNLRKKRLGKACKRSTEKILEHLRDVKGKNYNSYFSTLCDDTIYRTFLDSKQPIVDGVKRTEFTIETLNAMLCWFFVNKEEIEEFEEHTIDDLRSFFALIEFNNKTARIEEIEKFNNFISDINLIKDEISEPFNNLDLELNELWEFSIIDNNLSLIHI